MDDKKVLVIGTPFHDSRVQRIIEEMRLSKEPHLKVLLVSPELDEQHALNRIRAQVPRCRARQVLPEDPQV